MDADPALRAAKSVVDELIDIISLAYPKALPKVPHGPPQPLKPSTISNPPKRKSLLKTPVSRPKKMRVTFSTDEKMSYTPSVITPFAKKLVTNCFLCSKNAVNYQAVEGDQMIYLCSEGCYSKYKLGRKNHRKTRCVRCLQKLDLSSLSFRPVFGLTDRPCCSEICYDAYNTMRSPTFMCRFGHCNSTISSISIRWQTMEFCHLRCLSSVFQSVATKCTECNKKSNQVCQFSQRFGILIKHFCTSQCFKSFLRRNDRRCPSCNGILLNSIGGTFCSPLCQNIASQRNSILSSMKEYDQPGEICDICQCFTPLADIEVRFHNYRFLPIDAERYIFICSSKCTAAYRQHHRIPNNMCTVCNSSDWSGTGIFYRSGPNDLFIFCSSNCLAIYIYTTKYYVICDYCGKQKTIFNSIEEFNLSDGSSKYYCSLKCCRIVTDSNQLSEVFSKKLCVIKCANCRCISKNGIHEQRPNSNQIISFCSPYCQYMGPSPPIILPTVQVERIKTSPPQSPTPENASGPQVVFLNSLRRNFNTSINTTPPMMISAPPEAPPEASPVTAPHVPISLLPRPQPLIWAPSNTMQPPQSIAASSSTQVSSLLTSRGLPPDSLTQMPTSMATQRTSNLTIDTDTRALTNPALPPHQHNSSCSSTSSFPAGLRELLNRQVPSVQNQPPRQNESSPHKANESQQYINFAITRTGHPPQNLQLQNGNLVDPSGIRLPLRIAPQTSAAGAPSTFPVLPSSISITRVSGPAGTQLVSPNGLVTYSRASPVVSSPGQPYNSLAPPAFANLSQFTSSVSGAVPVSPSSLSHSSPYTPLQVTSSNSSVRITPYPATEPSAAPSVPPVTRAPAPPPPPTLPVTSLASAALPSAHLVLVRECVKPKLLVNAEIQAAPKMVSKAVMCKPLNEPNQTAKPVMVTIETQTDMTWVDDDVMIIEARPCVRPKSITNGVNGTADESSVE